MARLIYQTQSEQKAQLAAMINSRRAKKEKLIDRLQDAKRMLRKRFKIAVAFNIMLITYVIIRGIYG